MKQDISKIEYVVREPNTYMMATIKPDAELQDFCIEMAMRNQIPGVLSMNFQFEDGDTILTYDITGMRRISDVLAIEQKKEAVFLLLSNLVRSIQGLPNYFLHASQCLLSCDCVFVDRHFQVGLALAPLKSDTEDSSPLLKQFFMELIGVCTAGGKHQYYADLLAYLVQPDFHLEEFAELIQRKNGAAYIVAQPESIKSKVDMPVSGNVPQKPSMLDKIHDNKRPPVDQVGEEKKEKLVSTPAPFAIPGSQGGIAIPGGGIAAEEKKKGKKERREDGHKLFGFSLGKKKATPEVSLNEEVHIVSSGNPTKPSADAVSAAPQMPGAGQEVWHGTVSFEGYDAGNTELIGAVSDRQGLGLMYNGRYIDINHFPFTVGRSNCSFIIESPKVSRHHITFLQEGEEVFVRDESSSNHTYVDGVMLPPYTPYPLHDGAELRLGSERIQIKMGNRV